MIIHMKLSCTLFAGSSKPSGRQVSETGFARLQFSKSDLFTNNKDEVQRIKVRFIGHMCLYSCTKEDMIVWNYISGASGEKII